MMVDTKALARQLSGLTVSDVSGEHGTMAVHFTDGSVLVIESGRAGLAATVRRPVSDARGSTTRPTARQREYLAFIRKYMARFSVAPAESDIQRHFLVSAPSVNHMIQGLERRGYIRRERDPFTGQVIPRSIRVLIEGPWPGEPK